MFVSLGMGSGPTRAACAAKLLSGIDCAPYLLRQKSVHATVTAILRFTSVYPSFLPPKY